MLHTGFIRPVDEVRYHTEEEVRNLAGKKIIIFPETANIIRGHGVQISVTPEDLSNEEPIPILTKFISMDDRTTKVIERAVTENWPQK